MGDASTIYIGNKPIMNYVLAAVRQFNGENKGITIQARGRSISKAVDVALITKERFVPSNIQEIKINTELLMDENGKPLKVSCIKISMAKA